MIRMEILQKDIWNLLAPFLVEAFDIVKTSFSCTHYRGESMILAISRKEFLMTSVNG